VDGPIICSMGLSKPHDSTVNIRKSNRGRVRVFLVPETCSET